MKSKQISALIATAVVVFTVALSGCADNGVRTFTKDLAQDAEDYRAVIGYKEGTTAEDGSVTYAFSKDELKELKERYQADIQKKTDEITKGKSRIESIRAVVFSGDYKQFDVYVEKTTYSVFDTAYVLPFLRTAAFMRVLNGADASTVDATMYIIAGNSGEVLSTTTYRRIFAEE